MYYMYRTGAARLRAPLVPRRTSCCFGLRCFPRGGRSFAREMTATLSSFAQQITHSIACVTFGVCCTGKSKRPAERRVCRWCCDQPGSPSLLFRDDRAAKLRHSSALGRLRLHGWPPDASRSRNCSPAPTVCGLLQITRTTSSARANTPSSSVVR